MKDEQSHGAVEQSSPSALTAARIALGLTGPAIPTREHLRFQLDHALARDAVHARLDVPAIQRDLQQRSIESLSVYSAASQSLTASDRGLYLRRPDLGRTLSSGSRSLLEQCASESPTSPDLVFILADGLSSLALERHATAVLDELSPRLDPTWITAPVSIATEARVGLGDQIGQILRARLAVVLIGERPGLSSPDSLGAYITWQPCAGRTDAERNCISNIRSEGLSYAAAASRILFYLQEAMKLRLTGVGLKEGSAGPALPG
jgi:ethanolamine ammonia-lyase small subunit